MKYGARVAIGVAGGYFLGRTKKMKLALMFGAMAAGRQVGGPGELLGSAGKLIGQSPELSALTDQVRDRLLEAGKGAALAVASRQVEVLTDRVGRRVESLGDLGAGKRAGLDERLEEYDDYEEVDTRSGTGDEAPVEDSGTADASSDDSTEPARPAHRSSRARAGSSGSGSGGDGPEGSGSGSGRSASGSSRSGSGSGRSGSTARRSTARSSASKSEGGTAKRASSTARRTASGSATAARRTTAKATGQRGSARSTRGGGEESDG